MLKAFFNKQFSTSYQLPILEEWYVVSKYNQQNNVTTPSSALSISTTGGQLDKNYCSGLSVDFAPFFALALFYKHAHINQRYCTAEGREVHQIGS